MINSIRRLLLGAPIATERSEHEKVGIFGGLAVFAADAMSSVAYGPEEVLIALWAAGTGALQYGFAIGIALAVLLAIVATSYRQTVLEYPSGGGAYVVARDNLGIITAQVAGAALLTDYVLTVSVSVASGIDAVTSAWPQFYAYRIAIMVGCILLITVANLRGVRESAAAFSLPVYGFVVMALITIAVGLWKLWTGQLHYTPPAVEDQVKQVLPLASVTTFLVLRAFSSGCASLTGVEAVANGVQAFKEPRAHNAAKVMVALALILGVTVVGVSYLAHYLHVIPMTKVTVLSQIGTSVFGHGTLYYVLQITTMLILIFAANTSFSDFPRLSALHAADGFMPRQLTNLGDRLVFQNGIVALAVLAAALVIGFKGDVTRLIPLYAIGVFSAFTTSQVGMVVHWRRKRGPLWKLKSVVNGTGAVCTGVVLVVIAIVKFALGAWVVIILIPVLVLIFLAIEKHYAWVASRLTLDRAAEVVCKRNLTLLLVGGMHRGTLEALNYVACFPPPVRAVHIEARGEANPRIKRLWEEHKIDLPLVIVASPYRSLYEPLIDYIKKVKAEEGFGTVTVVVPEFITTSWWMAALHNQSALRLQFMLRNVAGVTVVNMRYEL